MKQYDFCTLLNTMEYGIQFVKFKYSSFLAPRPTANTAVECITAIKITRKVITMANINHF